MISRQPALVLVPGSWHRPSAFDLLRGELDTRGYATRTVKLPTTGPDPHGNLHDDAAAVNRAIEALSGPVAVIAHSYGGIRVPAKSLFRAMTCGFAVLGGVLGRSRAAGGVQA